MTDALDTLAKALRACLVDAAPDRALVALADATRLLSEVPMAQTRYGQPRPHDFVGVAIQMMAMAMVRAGGSAEARPFIDRCAGLFDWGHRYYARRTDFGDLVEGLPFLWVPGIEASIAEADWAGATTAILAFEDYTRHDPARGAPRAVAAADLVADPGTAAYGPFACDPAWMLGRQEVVWASGTLDRGLAETRKFHELFLTNALRIGAPARALPLIEADGIDVLASHDNYPFNAVCALAALGRLDAAMDAARHIVRHGYELPWRFDLGSAAKMAWTQDMRQNEWLAPLAATPRYAAFLREDIHGCGLATDDPTRSAICALRQDTWGGKKGTRCWLSRQWIAPGDPVVRIRRLQARATDGGFDIAAASAFEASGWAEARRAFLADAVPLACLFPKARDWHTPAISAFHHDVARDPAAFDLDRAVALIADHDPAPIRHEWTRGTYEYLPAFEPRVGDAGHGDAVNFAWRLMKAGFAPDLFDRAARLPREKADKMFAMLATFDRADCRAAAAAHFALPTLPDMMATAFAERPQLEAHWAMADFAAAHQRWRAGLGAAMRAYALHLYSNYHPGADWFLRGLEHFTHARGCQLLFFLIHHPEEDTVLSSMLANGWLPRGVSTGGFDAYDNACPYYCRAAVLNRMVHAPDQLPTWLERLDDDTGRDRETRRMVERHLKRASRKPKAGHQAPPRFGQKRGS